MKILFQFEKSNLVFENPAFIISCYDPKELKATFCKIEKALKKGLYVAGFLSYEAGYAFEDKFIVKQSDKFPLLYFGCYEAPTNFYSSQHACAPEMKISNLEYNMTRREYCININRIRRYIAAGDVYQITYCMKIYFDFRGDAYHLYRALLQEQPVPYSALIEMGDKTILSLSPEMFLKKRHKDIITKPMKGTWSRGNNIVADAISRWKFHKDEKNRAENVMIADLLRNDLGRIGRDIQVPKLFEITPYKTLFQMTSTVTAQVPENVGIYNLFKALFPSGSVTGAPKIRAMEIIREIEREKRNIYTGAIGYIQPNKDMFFNIPIRTLLIENGRGEMGIGGGIVWDSTPEGEWNEGILKAKFFTDLVASNVPPIREINAGGGRLIATFHGNAGRGGGTVR